jgi:carboxymethylenebutenolidase
MAPIRTFAFLCCFASLAALAQDWAKQGWARQDLEKSPRHQEWVDIHRGDRTLKAFVVYPEAKGKTPAVVIIHENTGLTDWARDLADQVAAAGYIAIAPDLLSGMGPGGGRTGDFPSADAAREAIYRLDKDAVIGDLDAVADFAKKLPGANGKIAVAGFCWGGGESFRFATNRSDLAAAFVFYGPPPQDLSKIHAPVYGFYGGSDARIAATVPGTQEAMKKAGKKYEPVTYEGAGHGFMRAGQAPDASPENKKARDEAWQRWKSLLRHM